MINKILDKLLGLTFLGDIAEKLNGNKTVLGLLGLVFSVVTILLPMHFPELEGIAALARRVQELLLNMGVDIQTLATGSLALTGVGLAHKVVKSK